MLRGYQYRLLRAVALSSCFPVPPPVAPASLTSWAFSLAFLEHSVTLSCLKSSLLHVYRFSGSVPLITSGFPCDQNSVISLVNSLATRNLSRIATKMTSLEAPHRAEQNLVLLLWAILLYSRAPA